MLLWVVQWIPRPQGYAGFFPVSAAWVWRGLENKIQVPQWLLAC